MNARPKLMVNYAMWADSPQPFNATIKGKLVKFKKLEEAREAAKVAGYSGIRIKNV